jgi:hypothetical protein
MAEQTSNQDVTAWGLSRLGNLIDTYVDRNLGNQPQIITDGAEQYGVAPDGTIYRIGQPNVGGQTAVGVNLKSDNTMLILIAVGLYFLFKKA